MIINSIACKDFRGIKDVTLQLDGKSTVLFGINGMGKSSILRGINLIYANILNKAVNRQGVRQNCTIQLDDIQYGKSKATIVINVKMGEKTESCACGMIRKGKLRYYDPSTKKIVSYIQAKHEENGVQGLPVFVNYGTNRLVLDVPLRIKTHHEFDMYSAYEKAIENRIDFRTFFEWFRNQEDYENQCAVEKSDLEYKDVALEAVRKAMLSMLEGCSNIRVARKPHLEMKVDKNGVSLNVTELSDGEKCTLALFGDLARRLTLANPNMVNPLLGVGVVLIDEIELHMHPSWQRKVLKSLRETFPNVQFIITTHSPLVLSESDEHYQLFYMNQQEGFVDATPVNRLDGYDVKNILEQFMGTSSSNNRTEELIHSIYKLIEGKEFNKAKESIEYLAGLTDRNYSEVVYAQMELMRRQKK